MSAKGTLEEAGERKRWRRGGCALRAHGDGLPGEAGESGEHEGDIGDREEESAGAVEDVRFALTGTGCVGRPVNLVGTKGTLGTGKRKVLAPRWMCASRSRRRDVWGDR